MLVPFPLRWNTGIMFKSSLSNAIVTAAHMMWTSRRFFRQMHYYVVGELSSDRSDVKIIGIFIAPIDLHYKEMTDHITHWQSYSLWPQHYLLSLSVLIFFYFYLFLFDLLLTQKTVRREKERKSKMLFDSNRNDALNANTVGTFILSGKLSLLLFYGPFWTSKKKKKRLENIQSSIDITSILLLLYHFLSFRIECLADRRHPATTRIKIQMSLWHRDGACVFHLLLRLI